MAQKTIETASVLPTDAPITEEALALLLTGNPDEQIATMFDGTGAYPLLYTHPEKGETPYVAEMEAHCTRIALSPDASNDIRLHSLDLLGRLASRYQHPILSQNIGQVLQAAGHDDNEAVSAFATNVLGSLKRWGAYPAETFAAPIHALETAFAKNNLAEGEKCFAHLYKIAPWNGWSHYAIGRLREEAGRFVEAADALATAVRIRPGWSTAVHRYALLLAREMGQPQKAVDLLEEHLEQSPSDVDLLYTLGLVYENVDRNAEALALYERGTIIAPDQIRFWSAISYHYARMKRYDDAIAADRKIVELKPDDPDAWHRLATAFEIAGRYAEGATAYGDLYLRFPGYTPDDGYRQAADKTMYLMPLDPFAK